MVYQFVDIRLWQQPQSQEHIYQAIKNNLRNAIESGTYQVGQVRLPSHFAELGKAPTATSEPPAWKETYYTIVHPRAFEVPILQTEIDLLQNCGVLAIAENMNTDEMKIAYQMAISDRVHLNETLVHHSDRGLQYCSNDYVRLSTENNISISMTENGDPYENALAERMNRTLKDEFGLGRRLPSKQQAFRLAKEAVELYNQKRPHLSLNMKTPNCVHLQKIPAT
jgi:transposase InsO family protein